VSYLLDTDICSDVLRRRHGMFERLRARSPATLHVCSITIAEAHAGARKSPRSAELLMAWDHFLQPFADRVLPFDKEAAEHYGAIRAHLELRGEMIGDRDCMIASIARHHGLVLVSANVAEHQRVPDLNVENWRVPARG
jgi:tRNA(fMet)-specific endonuclease VapC